MSSAAVPPTYQSRHEIESKEEMANDNESNTSTGSQYLQEVLGDVLADALSKVAKERPVDPIQYVADYLHGLKASNHLEETFNDSLDIKEDEPEELEQGIDEFEDRTSSPNEKRTTQSEPPPSIQGSSIFTDSNPGSSTSNTSTTIILEEDEGPLRTSSLDRNQFPHKAQRRGNRKSTSFSRHLPAVAMSKNDYRAKRGLLPPMTQSPKSSPEGEPRINRANGAPYHQKPRQLAPLADDSFDMNKHNKRNRKLTKTSGRTSYKR